MSDINLHTTARVTVHLEIKVSSTWGPDCSLEQVHKQAADEAIGLIRNAKDNAAMASKLAKSVRLMGEPLVTAIIVPKQF